MSYEKYYPSGWQSGETGGTPITPEALNHIETGLEQTYSDFAPAGYGLGDSAPYCNDCNTATKNGWYALESGTVHKPNGLDYAVMEVSNRYDTVIVQRAINYDGATAVRIFSNNSWTEWEWVNPLMVPGVEYRTTERWNGKAVYAQYFDFGALPNASWKSEPLPVSTTVTNLVDYYGHFRYGTETAEISMNYAAIKFQLSYNGYVRIDTTENLSTFAATFAVKYTKD